MLQTIFWHFDIREISVATMILFAVIDIIGSMPMIIKIKQKVGIVQPFKASMVAMGIMIAFLFIGESILSIIGIGTNEFAVAGSFILFLMAIEMVLGIEIFKHKDDSSAKVASVVPIAFPLIAGAGTMTSIISLRAEFAQINILIAILINMLMVYVVLKSTTKIEKILGPGGIAILEKVFGIILLAIAIKLFSSNITELFH